MADIIYSTVLVLWSAIKIIVSNPLLILAIMSIARRKLRS